MGVALTGVFSGINSDSIISQLIALASKPLQAQQTRKTKEQAKQTAEKTISGFLKQLQTAAEALVGKDKTNRVSAVSGDTKALTVSAESGAIESSHSVVIHRLASAAREVHAGLASADSLVGAGQFVYTYDGKTRTIQTTATTTLSDLRGLINNDANNPGVTASVLEHRVDDEHVFHLVLSGRDSGSKYGITIEAATTLPGMGPGEAWTQTQQAQDSQIQVDGYPSSGWIERSTNVVTDVIPGVTLRLVSATDSPVAVTLSRDTGQLTNNLQNLVSIYNTLKAGIDRYTGYDAATKTAGALQGDSTFSRILSLVREPLTGAPSGFAGLTIATPADIGLSIDKEGKLSLDTEKLSEALKSNYADVLNLIGAEGAGQTDSPYLQFVGAEATTKAGAYDVEVNYSASGSVTSARIRAVGDTAWRALDVNGTSISGQTGKPEAGLRLTSAWDGSSTLQASRVTVRQGLATVLSQRLDQVLDTETGFLAGWERSVENTIKALDSTIETMQKRLDTEQKYLKAQYARMEAMLAKMSLQTGAISALLGLTSSSSS